MASKAEAITVMLNSARSSNILTLVDEAKVRNLIEEYMFDEDVEDSDEEEDLDRGEEETMEEGAIAAEADPEVEEVDLVLEEGEQGEPSTSGTSTVEEKEEKDDEDDELVDVTGIEVHIDAVEEKGVELKKAETKNCGCKFKMPDGRSGCIKQFSPEEIVEKRMCLNAITPDEKDFYIMGLLNAHEVHREEMTQQKRKSRRVKRQLPRRKYSVDGRPVCREAFLYLLCLGTDRLTALQNQPLEARMKPTLGGRIYNVRALTAEDVQRVVRYLEAFTEDHGLCLPGRIPGYHRTDLKLVPSYWTKKRIWEAYKHASVEGFRVVGITSFKMLWKQYCPHIVVARPMTDLCNICQQNNLHILRGANTSDPNKLKLLEDQRDHLHRVNVEREFYNTTVKEAKATAMAEGIVELGPNPANSRDMVMGYSFDFAQQVHLPSSPMQPGPIYFMTPRKCGLFGVCCPAIPQQVNFIIDESMCCGKGSNTVISYVHYFFENYGLGETEAVLHCDNCSGQNKNNFMLWYLMWRVLHGHHRKISLNFMVPGHTKFAPDWCFGLLKQNFRRMEVHCLHDMYRAVTESATTLNKAQLVGLEDGTTVYVPTYDWQSFLRPYFKPLKGIKSLFHFKFDEGSPEVMARSTVGGETAYQLLRDPQNLPPASLPEPVPPPGLSLERRKYLFDNIRQFVRDDCKDLLCPE